MRVDLTEPNAMLRSALRAAHYALLADGEYCPQRDMTVIRAHYLRSDDSLTWEREVITAHISSDTDLRQPIGPLLSDASIERPDHIHSLPADTLTALSAQLTITETDGADPEAGALKLLIGLRGRDIAIEVTAYDRQEDALTVAGFTMTEYYPDPYEP